MQKHKFAFKFTYQKRLIIKAFLIFFVYVSLLIACHSYGSREDVTFIDSPGEPPAQSIVWSPTDINQVLVTSTDLNHHDNQIFILNARTLEKTVLQRTDSGTLLGLAWSSDGSRILFMTTTGTFGEKSRLLIISANGGDKEVLTEEAVEAAWSPDGVTLP